MMGDRDTVVFRLEVEAGCVMSVTRATRVDPFEPLVWRAANSYDDLDLLETALRVARAQRAGRIA
jgi:hypothetical protein